VAIADQLCAFRAQRIDTAVGTSKMLRSLARIAGAAPSSDGPHAPRSLTRSDAERLLDKLAGMRCAERAKLPGVSERRGAQLLAGAVVAATTMDLLGLPELRICPWALREGVMLTHRDATAAFPSWAIAQSR
jgi:exopolyphosphatase/guanosine-5'-triphosphate,3'-diphosphate pyrophosphatase